MGIDGWLVGWDEGDVGWFVGTDGWLVGVGVPVTSINITFTGQPALPVKRLCFADSTIAVVRPVLRNALSPTVARLLPYSRVIVARLEHR